MGETKTFLKAGLLITKSLQNSRLVLSCNRKFPFSPAISSFPKRLPQKFEGYPTVVITIKDDNTFEQITQDFFCVCGWNCTTVCLGHVETEYKWLLF